MEKRKRGAPRGNQNARKHGFYSRVLSEAERQDLEQATAVEGIDEEIALLRVKIKSVVAADPGNIRLIMQAVTILARLLRTRQNIDKKDGQGLRAAIAKVLKDIALPLGIGVGTVLKD